MGRRVEKRCELAHGSQQGVAAFQSVPNGRGGLRQELEEPVERPGR
jgi:hypothetical protein